MGHRACHLRSTLKVNWFILLSPLSQFTHSKSTPDDDLIYCLSGLSDEEDPRARWKELSELE
jgi:hypothetical protein